MPNNASVIRWFSDLSRSDTAIVGGKNALLGEMIGTLRQSGTNTNVRGRHGIEVYVMAEILSNVLLAGQEAQ